MGRDLPPVQTDPGGHPASCTMGTGSFMGVGHPASCTMGTGSFMGVKYGRGVLLNTHPILVPQSWKSRAIPLPTLWAAPRPVMGTLYLHLTRFCTRLSRPQGHTATGRIMSMKNSIDTIGNRTRDLPACSTVPHPTVPPRAPRSRVPVTVIMYIYHTSHPSSRAQNTGTTSDVAPEVRTHRSVWRVRSTCKSSNLNMYTGDWEILKQVRGVSHSQLHVNLHNIWGGGEGTALQAGRSRGSIPDDIGIFQ